MKNMIRWRWLAFRRTTGARSNRIRRGVMNRRRTALVVSVAGILVAACGGGDSVIDTGATTPTTPVPDSTDALDSVPGTVEIAYWPSFAEETYDVVVTEDIVYGQGEVGGGGSFVDLRLDLYAPQDPGQSTFPLVVVVHAASAVVRSRRATLSTGHMASRLVGTSSRRSTIG